MNNLREHGAIQDVQAYMGTCAVRPSRHSRLGYVFILYRLSHIFSHKIQATPHMPWDHDVGGLLGEKTPDGIPDIDWLLKLYPNHCVMESTAGIESSNQWLSDCFVPAAHLSISKAKL